METKERTRPTADALNRTLAEDGIVTVTTYTRSTEYGRRHVGFFREHGGSLQVRHGRGWNTLSTGPVLMVGIRRYIKEEAP